MITLTINLLLIVAEGEVITEINALYKWLLGGAMILIFYLYQADRKNWTDALKQFKDVVQKIDNKLDNSIFKFNEYKEKTDTKIQQLEDTQKFCQSCPK